VRQFLHLFDRDDGDAFGAELRAQLVKSYLKGCCARLVNANMQHEAGDCGYHECLLS
jgi:hypothetical protein